MDINVFCRPFDDKTQSRIVQEASAFVEILKDVLAGKITCIGSDILDIEANNTIDEVKRSRLLDLLECCSEKVAIDESILDLGNKMQNYSRLTPRDSLHIVSAARALSDYLLTCDDKVVKKAKDIQIFLMTYGMKLQILNPVDFLGEFERNI